MSGKSRRTKKPTDEAGRSLHAFVSSLTGVRSALNKASYVSGGGFTR